MVCVLSDSGGVPHSQVRRDLTRVETRGAVAGPVAYSHLILTIARRETTGSDAT